MTTSHRIGAAAGIVGPTIFVAISLIGGWLQTGYSALSDTVSALSLGDHGWVQIASFLIVGASLLLLAVTIARDFTEREAPLGGPIVLGIVGIGYLFSGPFVMDPPGTPSGAFSWRGLAHGLLGAIVFTLMPVTCFIFLRQFRRDPAWLCLWRPTLVFGCFVAIADIAFVVTIKTAAITHGADLTAIATADAGLLQRLVIIPFMTWTALLGARLLLEP